MDDQLDVVDKGGTMRLGSYAAQLQPGSQVADAYGDDVVSERHRHRYEVNPRYRDRLEEAGLLCSGISPDGRLVEFIELPGHPFWVGTQAHPEFKSRPDRPHPLFRELVGAALDRGAERARGSTSQSAPIDTDVGRLAESAADTARRARAFRQIGERTRISASFFSVVTGTFVGPDGFTFERDIVRHPGAVSVVPLDSDRAHVLLVRQYRGAGRPAAARDPRRHASTSTASRPSSCARRELAEEVGVRGRDADRARPLLQHPRLLRRGDAALPGPGPRPVEPGRHGSRRSTSIVEVSLGRRSTSSSPSGELVDAKTIIGLLAGSPSPSASDRARLSPHATAPRCRLGVSSRPDVGPSRGLSRHAEEYLTWLAVEQGRARNTIASYRRDLRDYEEFLAGAGAGRVDDADARRRRGATSPSGAASGPPPTSVARALAALRGLHRFCLEEGGATGDPTDGRAPVARLPQPTPKAIDEDEVELLLVDGDRRTTPASLRDRAILEVLYGTGMRISELAGLRSARPRPAPGSCGSSARATRSGSSPSAACARGPRRLARPGRATGARAPARGPGAATPRPSSSERRGRRLTRQGVWGVRQDRRRARRASRTRSTRTCCATRAPPTCSPTAPTSGWSRSCSATPRSPPPRSTRRSRPNCTLLRAGLRARRTRRRTERRRRPSGAGSSLRRAERRPDRRLPRPARGGAQLTRAASCSELGFGEDGSLTYDSNFADSSQVTAERGEAEALAASSGRPSTTSRRRSCKLDQGTYGICEDCGKPISPARLEAKPATRFLHRLRLAFAVTVGSAAGARSASSQQLPHLHHHRRDRRSASSSWRCVTTRYQPGHA